jgi:hypothetical protein
LKIRFTILFLLLVLSRFAGAQEISIDPKRPFGISYCNQNFLIAPEFTMSATITVTGMKISINTGYVNGEDELHMVGNTGLVQGNWYAAQGYLTLTGGSSVSDYIDAIRRVEYSNMAAKPTRGSRTITFSLIDADYLPETNHFYRFISMPNISWTGGK